MCILTKYGDVGATVDIIKKILINIFKGSFDNYVTLKNLNFDSLCFLKQEQ